MFNSKNTADPAIIKDYATYQTGYVTAKTIPIPSKHNQTKG
jgi:hypothetical protein